MLPRPILPVHLERKQQRRFSFETLDFYLTPRLLSG
jgi:hypothetical protein